jgi:molybdenum cofactor cytidylyltransferase
VIAVVPDDGRFIAALDGLPLRALSNREPERGISRSIALALRHVPEDVEALLIAVADQPNLTPDALRRLADAFKAGQIVVPRYGDHRGNPVIFDRRFLPELRELEGDRGGRAVVRRHPDAVVEVELPAAMGADIDRPEDWPA